MTKREVYGRFNNLCRELNAWAYRVEFEGGSRSDEVRYVKADGHAEEAEAALESYEETLDRADLQAAAQQIGFAWDALGVPIPCTSAEVPSC